MELHQLQYVLEVEKHKSFTKAADEICVTQSALSQQINKLEEELGVKLFERTTRTVLLTSAGREFITYARDILYRVDKARFAMQQYKGLAGGKLTIGGIGSISSVGLTPMLTSFQSTYPGINLEIITDGSYRLLELLVASKIDIGILIPPVENDINNLLDLYPLIDDEFVVVTPIKHPLSSRAVIDLKDLANENFIFPNRIESAHAIILQQCQASGFKPRIICDSSHVQTRLNLVNDGMGIAFASLGAVRACNLPGISTTRLTTPMKITIYLALLKNQKKLPPIAAFRDFALQWVKTNKK